MSTKNFDQKKSNRVKCEYISSLSPTASAELTQAHNKGKTRFSIAAFFLGLAKSVQFFASIAGVILLVYFIMQARVFTSKIQTIKEMQTVIGNLKASTPVLQLQLVDAATETENIFSKTIKTGGVKTFKLAYFNASGEIEEFETSAISLAGKNFYVDCEVYNFTYSLIEKGEVQNIAIPFRIYSDIVPPEEGIILNAKNSKGIPYSLIQTTELGSDFYEVENTRLKKFMEIINDPEKTKELGIIRSLQKAAVANYASMKIGETNIVTVENTGGLTLRKKR